jgi:hypothetical protein
MFLRRHGTTFTLTCCGHQKHQVRRCRVGWAQGDGHQGIKAPATSGSLISWRKCARASAAKSGRPRLSDRMQRCLKWRAHSGTTHRDFTYVPAFIMNTARQMHGSRHRHPVSVHDEVESVFTISGIGSSVPINQSRVARGRLRRAGSDIMTVPRESTMRVGNHQILWMATPHRRTLKHSK